MVLVADALGVARGDESVEDVGDHVEFGDGHFDLRRGASEWRKFDNGGRGMGVGEEIPLRMVSDRLVGNDETERSYLRRVDGALLLGYKTDRIASGRLELTGC